MAWGQGKYDDACTVLRQTTKARGAIALVFDGVDGSGFSVQTPLNLLVTLPAILRSLADQIEGTKQ